MISLKLKEDILSLLVDNIESLWGDTTLLKF